MEETKLEEKYQEELLKNLETTKKIMEKQVSSFGRLLMGKITENYEVLDKELLAEVLLKYFTTPVCLEIDNLFKLYQKQELEFYSKNFKTVDLIFNTLKDKRTQTIYLENIIKKINEKEEDIRDIFIVSAKDKLDSENKGKSPNLNAIYERFVQKLINTSNLSVDESEELYDLANRYYKLFKIDISSALEQLFSNNKKMAITKIENEINLKQIRKEKTSSLSEMEKSITNEYLDLMERMLEKTILEQKSIAKEELENCSNSLVSLFFKILPPKYQNQKELIDIIIDTNINERLGKLLDKEAEKLSSNLSYQNKDIIENEFFEEKKYQKIEDYQCDLGLINGVYQDVLHEICIAYNIKEDDQNTKRLKVVLLSEVAHSPKEVFTNFCDKTKKENKKNLSKIILEMHNLSDESFNEKETTQTNNTTQKK